MSVTERGTGASTTMSAERLVALARTGDTQAIRQLYDTHIQRVHGVVSRLTCDPEIAAECTQEAFVRAFRSLDGFRGDAAFGTWLHRVAVNVTLTRLRQVRRIRVVELELDPALTGSIAPRDVDPMLERRIVAALSALPAGYRAVVVMHDVEGFTHEEIGGILEIATGTSKARLSRARARLRTMLADCAQEYAAA
jgi:RNA polymerase sigma-70 factor, ECF subfamily